MYTRISITPSAVRASLRAMARGKQPKIPTYLLADILLKRDNALCEIQAPPTDDFVGFANRLYALEDRRGEPC